MENYFRAQTWHIAERLQTRSSLFIKDRLQYEPDALSFLEEKKAETDTLILYTHSAVWFPVERVFQAFGLPRPPGGDQPCDSDFLDLMSC